MTTSQNLQMKKIVEVMKESRICLLSTLVVNRLTRDQSSRFSIPQNLPSTAQSSASNLDGEEPIERVDPGWSLPPRGGVDVFRTWWLDLLSCILFTGAFIARVVTIHPYEGRPLPQ
jgi:hypothetical protein